MDWDDTSAKAPKQIIVGEPLFDQSVNDLKARIEALHAEISRTENELSAKRQQSAAADQLFKS